ncbi:hypothetical protein [Sphingomonas sp.]|uniref:kynureninase/PvdN C-terminal domain-containing protein n=1 Tax=Sphingomonas sp. TaxID=28214 RepID=UPI003AFFC389
MADSTSVNLFKLIVATCALAPERGTIVTEAGNFPTDLHVAREAAALAGKRLRVVAAETLEAAIDGDTALVVLAHVHYRSGWPHDMAALTAHARERGARIVWDLSHSVARCRWTSRATAWSWRSAVATNISMAGRARPPSSTSRGRSTNMASPIAGWLGHAEPFTFGADYAPASGVARFQVGTPPMLSLLALEEGVRTFDGVDLAQVWAKSRALFDLFADRAAARCPALRLVTPREPDRRGSHISFAHDHAQEIVQAAIADGVIGDFRVPAVARFGTHAAHAPLRRRGTRGRRPRARAR